ncbi:TetR/AcrR family transcriptional regulator [Sporomusa aerivorans]|uniref:TetR/AcrR family transcriptional regulator n=1 Tax=Sporomusa aerivorans TaxID=204936 RepID=UPI00352B752A
MARTPQDPQIRIDEILDAAEPLFSANGYRKTTISDIAKQMGVAQGMLYYYFKSKEEILEALINRQISTLLTDVKKTASSPDTIPPRKIEFMIYALFRTAQYKDGLFLDFLYDEKHLHIKNKIFRQATLLLKPWLLKIIEEGARKHYFHVSHLPTAMTFIMSIMLCLGDSLCEKIPEEIMAHHLNMAESLIEKALGIPEKSLHFSLCITH